MSAAKRAPLLSTGISWKKTWRQIRDSLVTQKLYSDSGLVISALKGQGDTGVVVFSSLFGNYTHREGLEMAGTANAKGTRPSLFVRDKDKAWFQDSTKVRTIVDTVRAEWDRVGVRRSMTTGGSMGAYGAIVFARDLGARTALAFGPQYDVSLETMPDDPRWREQRGAIREFSLGAIGPWLDDRVQYYVLHGRDGPDIVHWSRWPVAANMHHFLIRGQGHPVSIWLKEIGRLQPVFDAALTDDRARFEALMAEVGGERRKEGETWATVPNGWYRNQFAKMMDGIDLSGTGHDLEALR